MPTDDWTRAPPTAEGHFQYRSANPEERGEAANVLVEIHEGEAVVVNQFGMGPIRPRPCSSFAGVEWCWRGPLPNRRS